MKKDIHDIVRRDYANIALQNNDVSIVNHTKENEVVSATVGYLPEELAMAPEEANLGLGCGNPHRKAEIQLGEIENLLVADNTADVCISNCVINMSDNKWRVYREIFRTLKPGGRISICDIVIMKELTQEMKEDEAMHSC